MADNNEKWNAQKVASHLAEKVKEGTAPWQKPWRAADGIPFQHNPTTNKPYRSMDQIAIMVVADAKGYSDHRWVTYNTRKAEGWQGKTSESGVRRSF